MKLTIKQATFYTLTLSFLIHAPAHARYFLGASAAASFAYLSKQSPQIVYASGGSIIDAYPLNKQQATAPLFGLFTGDEWLKENHPLSFDVDIGVYSNFSNYPFKGKVIETAQGDPSTTLYQYQYHVQNTRLMAEAQMNWLVSRLVPFVQLGIGSSWNRATAYGESALTANGYPPLPPFQSNTQAQFAYEVGAGLSTLFSFTTRSNEPPADRITLGYRYVNSGKTAFGTRGPAYPYALSFGTLSANELYLGYTRLF